MVGEHGVLTLGAAAAPRGARGPRRAPDAQGDRPGVAAAAGGVRRRGLPDDGAEVRHGPLGRPGPRRARRPPAQGVPHRAEAGLGRGRRAAVRGARRGRRRLGVRRGARGVRGVGPAGLRLREAQGLRGETARRAPREAAGRRPRRRGRPRGHRGRAGGPRDRAVRADNSRGAPAS